MPGLIIAIVGAVLLIVLLRKSIDSVTGKNILRLITYLVIGVFLLIVLLFLIGRK